MLSNGIALQGQRLLGWAGDTRMAPQSAPCSCEIRLRWEKIQCGDECALVIEFAKLPSGHWPSNRFDMRSKSQQRSVFPGVVQLQSYSWPCSGGVHVRTSAHRSGLGIGEPHRRVSSFRESVLSCKCICKCRHSREPSGTAAKYRAKICSDMHIDVRVVTSRVRQIYIVSHSPRSQLKS